MRQTLIAESKLPNACDVFVLSEGAHRYRDALALAELLRNLGLERDVQIWPVLSPREGGGDRQRGNLAAEQRLRLIQPKSIHRAAIVIGRAELFGPDIDLHLLPRLLPARPVRMEDEPSPQQTYREMTLEGRLRRKPAQIAPKGGPLPLYDRAAVYSGWQSVGAQWRRIVILEGISALGTIGAVKAFCAPDCFPSQLAGVGGFFATFDVKLKLRSQLRGPAERALIRKSLEVSAATIPWTWHDISVGPAVREWRAVANIERIGLNFSFLGTPLPLLKGSRNDLRNMVLARLVSSPSEWIEETELFQSDEVPQPPGGRAQALKQVLDFLVTKGVFIERDEKKFRHIATAGTIWSS